MLLLRIEPVIGVWLGQKPITKKEKKMKTMRYILSGIIFLALAVCSNGFAGDATVLKFAHEAPEQHIGKGQTAVKLSEYIDELSNGKLKINVYPGGQLIPTKGEIRACARGQVDFIAPYTSYFAAIEPEFALFYMPMMFENKEQAVKNFKGAIGEQLLASLQPHGLKGLAIWHDGPVYLFTRKGPIRKAEDMKGMKIRTFPSKPTEAALKRARRHSGFPTGHGGIF